MLQKSTIQLLRIPFSLFLMPVFFFAVSQSVAINIQNAILVFFILHLFIYPASNGYNSYIDKDTESIGGIKNPLQPTRQLFYTTLLFDLIGMLLSIYISTMFFITVLIYVLASRAYSSKLIRLKKYPVIGFLTVFIFQGAHTFFMVMCGVSSEPMDSTIFNNYLPAIIACSFLIGGVYPLTQIYQHKQDKASGDITISIKLGYKNTFVFCAVMFVVAMGLLFFYFNRSGNLNPFYLMQMFLLPSLIYFFYWFYWVMQNTENANFKHTMNMNLISAVCLNLCFITLILIKYFG